ncbi:hypothetical protein Pmani_002288 [Petrolisthes manimaculis]|uniref:Sulfatase N-terminal domain-containing protein n=1 Tax=Petrolisthes manimaculis TaxID=1843537 RepID=A0AAE1QKV1_9EUCA|nr:hypothetical protein Pmani_002288 [Petrolisthes manimaculis]
MVTSEAGEDSTIFTSSPESSTPVHTFSGKIGYSMWRGWRKWSVILTVMATFLTTVVNGSERIRPNIVILVADDLGIGDVGCYGNDTINTPHINRLAKEGVKLNHHLAAASMCTPSRAALLTARYPQRYGLVGDENTPMVHVHVASRVGLPLDEVTLATALSAANYSTAAVGKWHLGQNCGLLGRGCRGPHQHGFQSFYGLPFTLVMESAGHHPFWIFPLNGPDPFYKMILTVWLVMVSWAIWRKWRRSRMFIGFTLLFILTSLCWFLHTHYRFHTARWWQVSPWMDQHMNSLLMDNDQVVEQPLELEGLSQKLVARSVHFINTHAHDGKPFFLYHSFPNVHEPIFTSKNNTGMSVHGRYGDNVEEMDNGVGEILAALDQHNLAQSTIVYFLSDHGGVLEAVDTDGQRTGGYNGPFKGGKGQGGSEGGIRIPGILRWPGHIPANTSVATPTSLLDTLPTMLHLAGLPTLSELLPHLPQRELDGMDIADLLTNGVASPSRSLLHHCGREIHAVRLVYNTQVYKLHMVGYKWSPGSTQCGWGSDTLCSCFDVIDYSHLPKLYELSSDPFEDHPVPENSTRYLQVTGIMKQFLAEWKARIPYPPSQYSNKWNTMHSMWLQPFKSLL